MEQNIKMGLIRVATFYDEELLNIHGKLLENRFKGLIAESRCIKNQESGIYDDDTEIIAKDKIIKLAKEFEKEKKDVILISCASDPALEESREQVNVPIIGAGSSCASLALALGSRIGVIGIGKTPPRPIEKILGDSLVEYVKPDGINNTFDLLRKDSREKLLKSAYYLKDKGCGIIALGCTGMATIEIASEIRSKLAMPVIDPLIASGIVIS